jgi:hypothetical protein
VRERVKRLLPADTLRGAFARANWAALKAFRAYYQSLVGPADDRLRPIRELKSIPRRDLDGTWDSAISAPSSGGVCSSAIFTALTIWLSGSVSASRISLLLMVKLRGTPSLRLRPLTSISLTSLPGKALPKFIQPERVVLHST